MCWALFESCPVCRLGNIMSGTVAIIPVKASSAGVEYSNPLFAPKHNVGKIPRFLPISTRCPSLARGSCSSATSRLRLRSSLYRARCCFSHYQLSFFWYLLRIRSTSQNSNAWCSCFMLVSCNRPFHQLCA